MPARDRIFVSYSHKDRRLFEEFKTMMAPAIQKGLVDLWDDKKIPPGAQWIQEIQKALASARIAVLLVSQNFLASHFIVEQELPPLLRATRDEGVSVFWIYLSSCLFEQTEIASYQAAHDVSRPLDRLSKSQRQAVLSKVCAGLIRAAASVSPALGPMPTNTGEGFMPESGLNYFLGKAQATDVLVPAAMVFVDVMRMLYTMAAPGARRANVHRFAEFIRIAEQHWGVLRTHVALHATMLPPRLRVLVAGIDRRLSGLLGKCNSGPELTKRELRLAFDLAQNTASAIEELGSQVPEYLALKEDVHRLAMEYHPATLDEYWRVRLDIQNQILRRRKDLQTIADDMDLKLALPYCAIDQELLGQRPMGKADIS